MPDEKTFISYGRLFYFPLYTHFTKPSQKISRNFKVYQHIRGLIATHFNQPISAFYLGFSYTLVKQNRSIARCVTGVSFKILCTALLFHAFAEYSNNRQYKENMDH